MGVNMNFWAYQYQTHHFVDWLTARQIEVEGSYRDTHSSRSQLSTLIQTCQLPPSQAAPSQTPPSHYVLIESTATLGDEVSVVHARIQEFWNCHVGLISCHQVESESDPDSSVTPLLIVPFDWPLSEPLPLGTLPPPARMPPQDWLQLGAQIERQQRSRTVELGHGKNRLQGKPPPGQAPYGYRRGKKSYLVDLRAAPVVKGFYEHFLLYGSLRRAVRFVAQTYGKSISVSTGKRWLTHPVYRGHLCYRQSEIISNTHPPLLTELEAAQVDRLVRRNQRFAGRSASAPRSLAGLVHCTNCGSGMTISQITKPRVQKQYLYLRPKACPNQPKCKGLPYDKVLAQTIETVCDRLPQAVANLNPPDESHKQALLVQIAQKESILTQVQSLLDDGVLDLESAQLRTFNLEMELSTLRSQLSNFPPVNLAETSKAIAIPEFWLDLSETERRFYLREFIQSIDISRQENDWDLNLRFVFNSLPYKGFKE